MLASANRKLLKIIDCGLAGYRKILELQSRLAEQRRNNLITDTIIIVEHYPVITLGAHKEANILYEDEGYIESKEIEIVQTRRGGGATAHNSGQVVIYPILNLFKMKLKISDYISLLEKSGKCLLDQFGIISVSRRRLPGLWVADKKIASIGVRVSRGITSHGMAINITNDLSIFDLFVPCGLNGVKMTSVLNETGKKIAMDEVKKKLKSILIENFSREYN